MRQQFWSRLYRHSALSWSHTSTVPSASLVSQPVAQRRLALLAARRHGRSREHQLHWHSPSLVLSGHRRAWPPKHTRLGDWGHCLPSAASPGQGGRVRADQQCKGAAGGELWYALCWMCLTGRARGAYYKCKGDEHARTSPESCRRGSWAEDKIRISR